MTTLTKGKTVETKNLQSGDIIHMEFTFYNVIYIRGLTFMLTVM